MTPLPVLQLLLDVFGLRKDTELAFFHLSSSSLFVSVLILGPGAALGAVPLGAAGRGLGHDVGDELVIT